MSSSEVAVRTGNRYPATILYVAQATYFAGAERALLLLLRALDSSRYRAHVIVGTDGEFRSQLDAAAIPTTYVKLRYTDFRRPLAWLQSVLQVAKVARSVRASLLHGNGVPGFQSAGYAARLVQIPAIVHVRGQLGGYSWFLRSGFDKALFVSNHLFQYAYEQDPKMFGSRTEVIYDGVVLPRLPSEAERQARLEQLNVPVETPSIVLSGQVVEVKGIWEYIDAARLLTAAKVDATYVVIGDDLRNNGETRRRAEEKVQTLGLAERFRFLGFRRDAADLMPLFDIAVMPSHREPLGLSALEAMAAGRPVVGSRVGGIMETVADQTTGLLVPPGDAGALANALGLLVRDSGFRVRLGRAGRDRAASTFGVAEHAARVQRVYDEVLATRRGKRGK